MSSVIKNKLFSNGDSDVVKNNVAALNDKIIVIYLQLILIKIQYSFFSIAWFICLDVCYILSMFKEWCEKKVISQSMRFLILWSSPVIIIDDCNIHYKLFLILFRYFFVS